MHFDITRSDRLSSSRKWMDGGLGSESGRLALAALSPPTLSAKYVERVGHPVLCVIQSCAWNGWATLPRVGLRIKSWVRTAHIIVSHPFRPKRGKTGAPCFV